MFFSYLGFIAFSLVLTAGAGANLFEVVEGIRKQGRIPLVACLLLALYAGVLVSLGGLMWLLSTIEWD